PVAQQEMRALPVRARPALDEVMVVLGMVPWNGKPINDGNPGGAVPWARASVCLLGAALTGSGRQR
ncbi:MAG: hypothetical protein ACRDTC_22115, partial [Pseudonocardiaceae bacterium]